jgi:hypothetical protein
MDWEGEGGPATSYTFTVRGDDWGKIVSTARRLSTVGRPWSHRHTYTVNLAAGAMHDVELHFYENAAVRNVDFNELPRARQQAISRVNCSPAGYALTVNNAT